MKEIKEELETEEANPDPEFLIKSIAEQGYSLESSLADLIDNSISANSKRIEILINTDSEPFKLFLADDGDGMDEDALKKNLKFPSSSLEELRNKKDLGRFGLGLKTASFAQTRCFTVLSRKKGDIKYSGRTWDVEYLRKVKKWKIIVNKQEQIETMLHSYRELSTNFIGEFSDFRPNTIVVWHGLYKFEKYLHITNRSQAVKTEITEITSDYLSLVFHRFLEKAIQIRINNNLISPFNPFPFVPDLRKVESNHKLFKTEKLTIEGYILPSRSIQESRNKSVWTLPHKSLMDMEGIYIYRTDRLILYGGWNGIINKAPRLQLARIKVDIGNSVDEYFHLNVAKSSIVIPYDLRVAFLRYVSLVKVEAEKEYLNTGIRKLSFKESQSKEQLFLRKPSSKGMLLEVNLEFSVVKRILENLNEEEKKYFIILMRMINTTINKIRNVHEDSCINEFISENKVSDKILILFLKELRRSGLTSDQLKRDVIPSLGIKFDTLTDTILTELNY